MLPTLAFDIGEYLGLIVFLVIMVGGWVINTINESKGKSPGKKAGGGGSRGSSSTSVRGGRTAADGGQEQGDSVGDELAARRRRELEELAARRRAMRQDKNPRSASRPDSRSNPRSGQPASATPTNMNAGQLHQRNQDRLAYQNRAKAMREQAEAARQTQQKRQALQSGRSSRSRSGSQQSSASPSVQGAGPAGSQQGAVTRSRGLRGQALHEVDVPAPRSVDSKKRQVGRVAQSMIEAAESDHTRGPRQRIESSSKSGGISGGGGRLRGQSLREAMILKTLLDPPMGLQPPGDIGGSQVN